MKSTTMITFHGGTYGTYLEWALSTLTSDKEIVPPFGREGNSHGYHGNWFPSLDHWESYLQGADDYQFARIHPREYSNNALTSTMDRISDHCRVVINLYPARSHDRLCMNNYYYKVWDDWWQANFYGNSRIPGIVDLDKIYENWPVPHNQPLNLVDTWIKREFLSFYFVPMWYQMVEWYFPDHWKKHNSLLVTTQDLLFNFKQTLEKILDFADITPKKNIASLLSYHKENMSRQKNINQDQLCDDIIDSVVNDTALDWKDQYLSLPSQAWLQWKLRDLGLDLACHNLDIFPDDHVKLKKLLFPL